MEEVEVKKQCRVCLELAEVMIDLFGDPRTTYKLEICCGVTILNLPTLPSTICKKCVDVLNVAYGFRVLCQNSQEYLNDHKIFSEDNKDELISEKSYIPDLKLKKQTEYIDEIKDDYSQEEEHFHDYESVPVQKIEENTTVEKKIENEETNVKLAKKTRSTRSSKKSKSPITLMCSICGNIFKSRATFSYHMKHHKKEKQYECEICSKRFMQTCELQAHIRVHTGEKPFACQYCERRFSDRSGVTRHERTHTNERPYGCTICGTHFSYSATLKIHQRVHTGEKPFRCDICDRGFAERHKLKAHLNTIRHAEVARKLNEKIK